MVHCRLQPGAITRPVRHRTVDEMWTCIAGRGRLWLGGGEWCVLELEAGVSCAIPVGTPFQFRNDGGAVLDIVIATVPPWPGEDEAELVDGPWKPAVQ